MAGCTSPQAPIPFGPTIAGLSIPDTINFGMVRAGVAKDTNIIFKNTGTDTIFITSQSFSNSSFKLSNSSQSKLSIAPGTSQTVSIQFLPSDTSPVLGYDTIRTAYKTSILVLRGGAVPFSSIFLSAPSMIYIGLSGLIGKDTNGTTHPFTFSFSAAINRAASQNNSFTFYTSTGVTTYESGTTRVLDSWTSNTNVFLRIDSSSLLIDTLVASYYYFDQPRLQISTASGEGLNIHGIKLSKDSNYYSAAATGAALNSIIKAASYYTYTYVNDYQSLLTSIVGYQDSAKLTIWIQ
jgi:Abnormal spindle-like microcephaly-assoc'd, ASPM-SPD-2-Hydin